MKPIRHCLGPDCNETDANVHARETVVCECSCKICRFAGLTDAEFIALGPGPTPEQVGGRRHKPA